MAVAEFVPPTGTSAVPGPGLTRGSATLVLAALVFLSGCGDSAGPASGATHVAFIGQPRDAEPGVVLETVSVSVTDEAGRPRDAAVALAIDDNTCGAVLSGTASQNTVNGVAHFDDLAIDRPRLAYHLTAVASEARTVSTAFDLTASTQLGSLTLVSTLCIESAAQRDAESLAYVPEDDTFWLADDDRPSLFAVARDSGAQQSRIDAASLLAALPDAGECHDGDGNPATSCSYFNELETMAYDAATGQLFAINTVNHPALEPPVDKPAIYRLHKDHCPGCFVFDSWQELPKGFIYGAAVVVNGSMYLGNGRRLHPYDYASNRVSTSPIYTSPSPIVEACFDGHWLWVLTEHAIRKVDWASRVTRAVYALDPVRIQRPRGISVVDHTLYVLDGRPPHRIFVLRESGP